jgi:hypothetical protein
MYPGCAQILRLPPLLCDKFLGHSVRVVVPTTESWVCVSQVVEDATSGITVARITRRLVFEHSKPLRGSLIDSGQEILGGDTSADSAFVRSRLYLFSNPRVD